MRILVKLIFLSFLLISISFLAEAQFIKNLKQAAYRGMENTRRKKKVEQEVEKMIGRHQLEKQFRMSIY